MPLKKPAASAHPATENGARRPPSRALEAQYQVATVLAEGQGVNEAMAKVLAIVCEALDCVVGGFWMLDESQKALRCVEFFREPQVAVPKFERATREAAFPSGVGLPGRVWASGKPEWIADVTTDENFPRAPAAQASNIHGAFAFPVIVDGRTAGVIESFSSESREPDAGLAAAVAAMGNQLGQFIKRLRAEEELLRRSRDLDDFFDNAAVGLHWVAPDGEIIRVNAAELHMLGYSSAEYLGHNIAEFHADPSVVKRLLERLAGGEIIQDHPATLKCRDGSLKDVLIDSSAYFENGQFIHTRCFTRDITSQKRAAAELTAHLRQLEGVHRIAAAVARDAAPDEVYQTGMDVILSSLQADRASLLLFDPDGVMRFKAWRGLSDEYRSATTGHTPWRPETSDARPIHAPDARTDPSLKALLDVIESEGIRSLAFIPLLSQNRVIGKFMVYYDEPHAFTQEESRIAETIAHNLAFAIERSSARQAVRDSEAQTRAILESAVDAIITIDEAGVIQSVNPASSRLFGYKPEEMLGAEINLLMPPSYSGRHGEFLGNYLKTGEKKVIGIGREVTGRRKDGSEFPIELTVSEMWAGGRRLFTGVVRDISERKQAEQERETLVSQLQAERSRIGNLVHDVPGVVWEAYGRPDEKSQRIDFVSDHIEEMLGYAVEEWLSTPNFWLTIVPPQDRERAGAEAAAMFAGGKGGLSRFRWQAKDGRIIWVEARSTVITDEAGTPIGMRGVTMDITDRKLAEERQQLLAEASSLLAASLDYGDTLTRVAQLLAGPFADVCSIDMVEGAAIRRLALAQRDAGKAAALMAMDPVYYPQEPEWHPVTRVTRSCRSELHETIDLRMLDQAARDSRHLRLLRSLNPISAVIVPLLVAGESFGAITLVSTDRNRLYGPEDLSFAEELARRAAIAIDNARRYQAEERARSQAEQAVGRTSRLLAITSSLSEALTPAQVAAVVTSAGLEGLGARSAFIGLIKDNGRSIEPLAVRGVSDQFAAALPQFAADPPASIIKAIKSGKPIFSPSAQDLLASFPDLGAIPVAPGRAFACIPLVVESRAIGAMVLTFDALRLPDPDDRELFLAIGRLCGQALERARLYEAEQEARRQAEFAVERTARLQAASAATSEALTPRQVASTVIRQAMRALGAQAGSVAQINRQRTAMSILSAVGYPSDGLKPWRRVPLTAPLPPSEVARTGVPLYSPSRHYLAERFPAMAGLPYLGFQASIVTPLIVDGQTIGVAGLNFREEREFSEEDKTFVSSLGRLLAQALERARLYEAERAARKAAEEANQVITRLEVVAETALAHLDLGQLLQQLLEPIRQTLAVDTSSILLLEEDGRTISVWASAGLREEMEAGFSLSVGEGFSGRIAATRRPLVVNDTSRSKLASAFLAKVVHSLMGVPLIVDDRLLGVLHVGSVEHRAFTKEELRLLQLIGYRVALGIERARLYREQQAARAQAEVARERQSFLAEASAILASSLDHETTLRSLAELCVPRLGDWCAIDTVTEEGGLHRVAVVHTNPAKLRFALELENRYPPDIQRDPELLELLRSGKPRFYPEITAEQLARAAHDEEHLRLLSELGLKSGLSVPLIARGRTVGVLTLISSESGRRYTPEDVDLALDLGRRAGLAVDNSRLYTESQRIQQELRVANEAKDEFLGLVSHELRTPITTVYGGARLLRRRGASLDEESKESVLDDIEHESERLHRIVEDLLVLARIELGQEVPTEPVLVQRVIEKSANAVSRRRPERQLRLHVDEALEPAAASAVYLEQILRNLLSNADKYSPPDEPIELTACQDGSGDIIISVRDHGPGIGAQELELIFERFYRSDRTAKQAGGAGIGLTVCKRLIEAQGGRIWAGTPEGGGLEVSFSLPAYKE